MIFFTYVRYSVKNNNYARGMAESAQGRTSTELGVCL